MVLLPLFSVYYTYFACICFNLIFNIVFKTEFNINRIYSMKTEFNIVFI